MSRTAPAARARSGQGGATVALGSERRKVYLVTGLQARHADLTSRGEQSFPYWGFWRMLTEPRTAEFRARMRDTYGCRAANAWTPIQWTTEGAPDAQGAVHAWTFESRAQGVTYDIERVVDKVGFQRALQVPEAMVLYLGHARLGRGPCFGPDGAPRGDDWEDGTAADHTTGLFRMGYPFLPTPAEEVHEHGYRPNLVTDLSELANQEDLHPNLRPYVRYARVVPTAQIRPPLAELVSQPSVVSFRAPEHYRRGRGEHDVDHVIHRAGFRQTRAAPFDLGGTELACRCFVHFGCSSFLHNQRILRRRVGWTRQGNERYAYFTTNTSTNPTPFFWLYHMLTYAQPSAGLSWEPWLEHVKDRTNADLQTSGHAYRMI